MKDIKGVTVAENSTASTAAANAILDVEPSPEIATRPRIRSGAIAWGVIVCAIAVVVLVTIGTPDARTGFAAWLGGLTPGGYVLIGVLALGGLILIWGLLGLIRRGQRQRQTS